jgi:peptidoglycan/LPS O-acetylase OafA/YrhL
MSLNPRSGDDRFRPDLEGLRGIAILLVLLCHVGIPGAEAGFVGVDVFFVLSGFLITGLLVEERERTGRIGLGRFYARRARRILPAAALVIASTLLTAQLVLSPLDVPRVADDALAAGLSLANVRFALDATDYFAPVDPSPLLHYWSLAVEEQFYLLWPALLLAAAWLGRPRLAMAAVALAVLVGSFALCFEMTAASGTWAYYSLPTRAWQLAAGGLLALAAPWISRSHRRVAGSLGWVGVAVLGASLGLIQPTTPYPGIAALLPTAGALAIIASGLVVGSRVRIGLGWTPFRALGRISYSLYLWHWPVLILGPAAIGLPTTEEGTVGPDLAVRLGLVVVALILSVVTWRVVEEPFRRGQLAQPGRRRGFALAATAVLIVVVGSTTVGAVAQRDVVAAAEMDVDVDPEPITAPTDPPPVSSPRAVGSPPAPPSGDPSIVAVPPPAPSAAPTPSPTPAPRPSPRIDGPVPRDLAPSLTAARRDEDPLIADVCGLSLAGARPPVCEYGDPNGAVTVALVGDSHASNWFPALEVLANQRGWRLVPFTKHSCVFVDMRIWSPHLKREYTECERWRENVVRRLTELRPDLVVIASNRWFPVLDDRDNEPERQGRAMARLIDRLPGTVAVMVDTPRSDVDVPACLAKHRDAIERCTTSRAAAFGWRHLRRETEAARRSGATVVDLSDATCPTDPCPPIIGTNLVYRDHHHLTATFAASLADVLGAALPTPGAGQGS